MRCCRPELKVVSIASQSPLQQPDGPIETYLVTKGLHESLGGIVSRLRLPFIHTPDPNDAAAIAAIKQTGANAGPLGVGPDHPGQFPRGVRRPRLQHPRLQTLSRPGRTELADPERRSQLRRCLGAALDRCRDRYRCRDRRAAVHLAEDRLPHRHHVGAAGQHSSADRRFPDCDLHQRRREPAAAERAALLPGAENGRRRKDRLALDR